MRYPNIKPVQGEQTDVNQRRYPDDNIEVAVERSKPESATKAFSAELPEGPDLGVSPENQALEERNA